MQKIITSVRNFFKTDFGIALIITAVWKVIMTLSGFLIESSIFAKVSLFSHTIRWDSGWYMTVIKDNYVTSAASAAFYPLFPLAVKLVRFISFNSIDITSAGQIVNTISMWFVIAALIVLGRKFLGDKKRFWLAALVLTAPAAFFLHVFYSEALFMALGFWAYVFALRRKWLYMGIALAFLTMARLPSVLIVGLCGLEFLRSYKWDIKRIFNTNLLYFLLASIGFMLFGLYLLVVRGDFFAMFHAYDVTSDWTYQIFDINFIKTIARSIYQILRVLIGQRAINLDFIIGILIPVVCLAILFSSSVYLLLKRKDIYKPLGIIGLLSIVMFTLNSNVVSIHRYILPSLTIYIALGLAIKGKNQYAILTFVCLAGLLVQFLLFSLFIGNVFAG